MIQGSLGAVGSGRDRFAKPVGYDQIDGWVPAGITPFAPHPILDEYEDVLSRPELHIRKGLRLQLLQLIKSHSRIVAPSRRLDVCGDPDDNAFLECADKAGVDYLITGNQRHFPEFWKKTKIITSREFIGLVVPHLIK